jgi:hypothetical protein
MRERPSFLVATAVNSLRACTLMVPDCASNSYTRSALAGSSERRYSWTLVSKNESASLMGFQSIELEVLGLTARGTCAIELEGL